MKKQNFANHRHWVPLYHFVTLPVMGILVIGSVLNILLTEQVGLLSKVLLLVCSLVVVSVSFHCRSFSLKVQDRVIRAEENFRYYMLTGKPLDRGLTLSQIIALRFASDDEFIALVKRILDENLDAKQIKSTIKIWREDLYRA